MLNRVKSHIKLLSDVKLLFVDVANDLVDSVSVNVDGVNIVVVVLIIIAIDIQLIDK